MFPYVDITIGRYNCNGRKYETVILYLLLPTTNVYLEQSVRRTTTTLILFSKHLDK